MTMTKSDEDDPCLKPGLGFLEGKKRTKHWPSDIGYWGYSREHWVRGRPGDAALFVRDQAGVFYMNQDDWQDVAECGMLVQEERSLIEPVLNTSGKTCVLDLRSHMFMVIQVPVLAVVIRINEQVYATSITPYNHRILKQITESKAFILGLYECTGATFRKYKPGEYPPSCFEDLLTCCYDLTLAEHTLKYLKHVLEAFEHHQHKTKTPERAYRQAQIELWKRFPLPLDLYQRIGVIYSIEGSGG